MANAIKGKPKGARHGLHGIITRLRDDTRGNVLMIVAAAILPLLCLIGSGIDLSRAYAAQARLQVACDAASLAGRRAMSAGLVDDTVKAEAKKFFNFNFPQGSFHTASFEPLTAGGDNMAVVVSANTTMPTSIMKLFGFNTLPLSVKCDAKQDFVNTDILLVLDVTGSMKDDASDGTAKIVALRSAVLALYDELKPVQDKLEGVGLRLRYGVVPYSSNVNVGKIVRAQNADYIVSDTWTYQSRVATEKVKTDVTRNNCNNLDGSWKRNSRNSDYGTCNYIDTTYEPRSHDVSKYVTGEDTQDPTTIGTSLNTWSGCIEERKTISTIKDSTDLTIPQAAKDLNIDLIPTDKDSRWAPFWPEVEWNPSTKRRMSSSCPVEAKRLKSWTRADMVTYTDSLKPIGSTYHDTGLIWGARFISPNGIFKSASPKLDCKSTDQGNSISYCAMPVARFVIFMTDGKMDTDNATYSLYGAEKWDKRITGGWTSETDQNSRHTQRTKMMCNAIKGMNVSVWVISFGETLTDTLRNCASSTSQASTLENQAQLISKFVEIGKNIGSLRLTQ